MSALRCPDCSSSRLLVYEETSYWINTGHRFCMSMKMQDSGAKVRCSDCDWEGRRKDLEAAKRQEGEK